MRKYLLAAVAALSLGGPAHAQVFCQTIGHGTQCSGPGGYSSHSTTLDNGFTMGNDSLGNSWNSSQLGSGRVYNFLPAAPQTDDDE